jgi:hypothetical protein
MMLILIILSAGTACRHALSACRMSCVQPCLVCNVLGSAVHAACRDLLQLPHAREMQPAAGAIYQQEASSFSFCQRHEAGD